MSRTEVITQEQNHPDFDPPMTAVPSFGMGGSAKDTQIAAKELGGIQARVYLAKQYPRNTAQAWTTILNACQREGLASVANYNYPVGGQKVRGPSIRLAEELARDWGNIDYGWSEIDRKEKESTVLAYAWDLETNTYRQVTGVIPLVKTSANGRGSFTTAITSEKDIYQRVAGYASRWIRNCILAIIPADIVDRAVEQCYKTMSTKVNLTPERIKEMLAKLGELGVSRAQIEARIRQNVETIEPAQFVRLGEIYTSIRDGMSEPSDWFDMPEEEEPQTASQRIKASLKAQALPKQKQEEEQSEDDATLFDND